jgi:flagellar basal-body rod modification protein FlgD
MSTAISGIGLPGAAPSTLTATGSSALGKDQFLKLLLAQLSNQDPTQPTDNQAFIAQLAQFSSLEQATNTNTRLESLLTANVTTNQTVAATYIGRDVSYLASKVSVPATGSGIQATLAQSAATVTATITNASGEVVRTLKLENRNAGALTIPWDGKSQAGTTLPNGNYGVKLEAADSGKKPISITQQGTARVTGISYESGAAQLIVNGLKINIGDILTVTEAAPLTPAP